MNKFKLTIEADEGRELFGRVMVGRNLIVDSAKKQEVLEDQLKQLICRLHKINYDTILFEVEYDLRLFFQRFDFLKISNIARKAKINESLLRQYASGSKQPSQKQVERIEAAVREIGKELLQISLAKQ